MCNGVGAGVAADLGGAPRRGSGQVGWGAQPGAFGAGSPGSAGAGRASSCGTEVTFRYNFETRWRSFRPLLDRVVGLLFRRDVRARLRGLKRAAEKTDILSRLGASCR